MGEVLSRLDKLFAQQILRPFDDLKKHLTHPYAYSAEYSGISKKCGDIAGAIRHFPEQTQAQGDARETCDELNKDEKFALIFDLADTAKHRSLRKKEREVYVVAKSIFEYDEVLGFRFMRTEPIAVRWTGVEFSYLECVEHSLVLLRSKLGISAVSQRNTCESSEPFRCYAQLSHDPACSGEVQVEATRMQFVRRNTSGDFIPIDPPEVTFVVV